MKKFKPKAVFFNGRIFDNPVVVVDNGNFNNGNKT